MAAGPANVAATPAIVNRMASKSFFIPLLISSQDLPTQLLQRQPAMDRVNNRGISAPVESAPHTTEANDGILAREIVQKRRSVINEIRENIRETDANGRRDNARPVA